MTWLTALRKKDGGKLIARVGFRSILAFAFVVLILGPVRSDTGLIAQWKFDEGSGGAAISPEGVGFQLSGPTWVTGKSGGAIAFDGKDDYGRALLPRIGTQYTISAWIRADQTYSQQRFVDFETGTLTLRVSEGSWNFSWNPTRTTSDSIRAGTVKVGQWQHLAATHDGNTAKLYVDGVLWSSKLQPTIDYGSNYIDIGGNTRSMAYFADGVVDDLRVYQRALTSSEIADIYSSAPSAVQSSTPVASALSPSEGYGGQSTGGRGGRIIEVTTLNDSGPGSLRAAIDASGPRIVVFRVGGTIIPKSPLVIRNPNITVAGQTAPGGGIQISGQSLDLTPLQIQTGNVILRYLRIRTGQGYSKVNTPDVVGMVGTIRGVILDHNSISWGSDENLSIWSGNPVENVTFSNNVISEALAPNNGLIVGSTDACDQIKNIDVLKNLFIHNDHRNPYLKVDTQRVINNIIYNWRYEATQLSGGVYVDLIGNLYKRGLNSGTYSEVVWRSEGLVSKINDCNYGLYRLPSFYIAGNKGPYQAEPATDNWNMMEEVRYGWSRQQSSPIRVSRTYQRLKPLTSSGAPVQVYNVLELEERLLGHVGASHRLNERGEWVPNRDAVDSRLINEYKTGAGRLRYDEYDAGGFPTISSGVPYTDQDHDGMADTWESMHGLSATNAADGTQDADGDNITNVEEFLNGTEPRKLPVGS